MVGQIAIHIKRGCFWSAPLNVAYNFIYLKISRDAQNLQINGGLVNQGSQLSSFFTRQGSRSSPVLPAVGPSSENYLRASLQLSSPEARVKKPGRHSPSGPAQDRAEQQAGSGSSPMCVLWFLFFKCSSWCGTLRMMAWCKLMQQGLASSLGIFVSDMLC